MKINSDQKRYEWIMKERLNIYYKLLTKKLMNYKLDLWKKLNTIIYRILIQGPPGSAGKDG